MDKQNEEFLQRIEVNPEVMVGKPVIRGTRIPIELIVRLLAQGLSVEEILEDYSHINRQDIRAALFYAASVLANEEVFPIVVGQDK